jgi:GTP-binding protein HflX
LPHHLVASFRASLEEASEADLLLHVIDASHPTWEEQAEVVERVLGEMGLNSDNGNKRKGEDGPPPERKRVIYVLNKADLLPDPEAFLVRARERFPHAVLTSVPPDRLRPSLTVVDRPSPPSTIGVAGLRDALRASAQALRPVARVRVPLGDGKLLAVLHRDAEVMGQEQVDGVVVVTARVQANLLGRLRHEGVGVEILG